MQFIAPYRLADRSNLALHFHPDHLADLRASGLNDDTIAAGGVYSLRPRDIALFFSAHKGVPEELESALCFPYHGATFARVKLFPPGPYATRPDLRKIKYAQPPKSGTRLYIPFQVQNGAVYLCEGEKKTLAAYQAGFNAVGIGGVWNWLSRGEPIADLSLIPWDGREVTLIPDSDIFQRVDLMRAVYALGREIRGFGANILVAQIPQASGAKVGLDDFLVAGGKVSDLDVFSLGHRIFKRASFWHGQWRCGARTGPTGCACTTC